MINHFKKTNSTAYHKLEGCHPVSDENVDRVKDLIADDNTLSIHMICSLVALSYGVVWRILRLKLKLYPMSNTHRKNRVEFCEWLLNQPDGFSNLVYFLDEKTFEERNCPNRQNERYWSNVDPEIEDENRVQGGRKVMCWAGLVNGMVVLHWFDENVRENQHIYLDMLQTVAWPAIKNVSNRRGYWFPQDGARPHTTKMVLDWLEEKFGNRIISSLTDRVWPPHSPDCPPLISGFGASALLSFEGLPLVLLKSSKKLSILLLLH